MPVEDSAERSTVVVRRLWAGSILLSLCFAAVLALLWIAENNAEFNTEQLTTDARVAEFLGEDLGRAELPTGVFVQSLSFENSSDVHLTGYIWQRWSPDLQGRFEQGLILPELIDSRVELREDYRVKVRGSWGRSRRVRSRRRWPAAPS